jgi:hypothetical protein
LLRIMIRLRIRDGKMMQLRLRLRFPRVYKVQNTTNYAYYYVPAPASKFMRLRTRLMLCNIDCTRSCSGGNIWHYLTAIHVAVADHTEITFCILYYPLWVPQYRYTYRQGQELNISLGIAILSLVSLWFYC